MAIKNWSGNLVYGTQNVYAPRTVDEVQQIVKSNVKIQAQGTRHCFNTIADNHQALLSTANLNQVIELDTQLQTVTVEAGIKYGELAPWLHQRGFALHNLASLPHISVGGSVATATHGSGVQNANLAAAVSALEIVVADGSIVHLSKADNVDLLNATVVGLGAFGVVTKITLDLVPSYAVCQHVYLNMPLTVLNDHFFDIVSAGYSVSLFTNWANEFIQEVWVKSITNADTPPQTDFYGAAPATENMHPIPGIGAEHCTEQMGMAGAWHDRLPHFKMGFTPSSGEELQTEYFIPIEQAVEAIMAVSRLGAQISPYLLTSEVRTIAKDELWMSPAYRQDVAAIHFTWKQDWGAVQKLLPVIERELEPYQPRPHWGKLFTMPPHLLRSRYVKLDDFKQLAAEYDPSGKFINSFLHDNLFS